jgi:hypothetical protein
MRPEIGEVEHVVGIQYPNQADIIEVQSFGDHLRPDQDIDPALLEVIDDALVGIFCPG